MLIFVLINLSIAFELTVPVEKTSKGEILSFTKMKQDECIITKTGSKKLVIVKLYSFILHFASNDCSGARISVEEIKPSSIESFSPKSIAALKPCRGQEEPTNEEIIYITEACSSTSSGSTQFKVINNSLITFDYPSNDCSGLSIQSDCVQCGESISEYTLVCSSGISMVSMVFMFIIFVISI
ncbi:hypothetical protein ENUP19_0274G0060 [Entamoeba nuttalli]|uniref:Uncharacterized protein n=2 Tax=Entamoeba nuttalli TaxID=412467 RepID=K2GR45_ENTNP|nr:hypothetical protein ENU1_197640 [Entamoeba nuttalli P19]EKE37438.1 hypothetical protein ENU1_197640 [Entamoeba nuttalli P19]|eukprot:XP_008860231.1 hypothetical protein ENU1_197640 [Entamoeba nuttalli P19]